MAPSRCAGSTVNIPRGRSYLQGQPAESRAAGKIARPTVDRLLSFFAGRRYDALQPQVRDHIAIVLIGMRRV